MNLHVNNWLLIFALICLTSSCSSSDGDDYLPFYASSIVHNVGLTIKQTNGDEYNYDNLIANKEIRIYGELSKKDFVLRTVQNNKSKSFIIFDADLPNTNAMSFNKDRTNGTGISKATIYIEKQKIPLTFHFVFTSRGTEEANGLNGIRIERIEQEGKFIPFPDGNITLTKDSNGIFRF